MELRPAEPTDRPAIRDVVTGSLETSYSLSPREIQSLLESEFSPEALGKRIEAADVRLFVAVGSEGESDGVSGFVEVDADDGTTLRWLHVHPTARGRGVGTALVERVREEVATDDRPLGARVLTAAAEGREFLERFGLTRSDSDESDFGGETFQVDVFTTGDAAEASNEPAVPVPETIEADGEERYLGDEDPVPGTEAPFFHVYSDPAHEEPYGYFCSRCGSTDVTADGLDRLQCGECGNHHDADEWDASFL